MSGGLGEYAHLLRRALPEARLRALGDPVANAAARRAEEQLSAYAERPVEFVHDVLGGVTWAAQRCALRELQQSHLVLNCGCRKSGKSRTAAYAGTWIMSTAPTRLIVTASSFQQVRNNVFAWIRKLAAGSRVPLPGRIGVTSWRMPNDPTWYAEGISVDKPDNIQGLHPDVDLPEHYKYDDAPSEAELPPPDPRLLDQDLRKAERNGYERIEEEVWKANKAPGARLCFLLDELVGMKAEIVESILGSLQGDKAYALGQFNPTFDPDAGHPAARFLKPGSYWKRIHTAACEPNPEHHGPVAGEPDSMFDYCFHHPPKEMVSQEWVERCINEWGPDSYRTLAHVYGLPSNAERERQFIPFRILKEAFDLDIKDDGRAESRHIGWDVAGSDDGDFNVAQLRVCGKLVDEVQWREGDTSKSTRRVIELQTKWGVNGQKVPDRNVHVDATGGSLGRSIVDEQRRQGRYWDGVDFGGGPENDWPRIVGPDTYFTNRKSELLWVFRMAHLKKLACTPRSFRETIMQAQWYTYEEVPNVQGTKLKCAESKDEIRQLYNRSPDNLEASILTFSRSSRAPQVWATSDIRKMRRRLRTN